MREFTGVGRTIIREHIPKRHLDFENPIKTDKVFDNTQNRIYGEKINVPMITESYYIGKSVNPADYIPKVGKKTLGLESDILKKVAQEIEEQK
jgi:hypothetical protein